MALFFVDIIIFCHPTMCSMSFNGDHSELIPAKKQQQRETKRKGGVLGYSRLLDYNSLLDHGSFNVDHSLTFHEIRKPTK